MKLGIFSFRRSNFVFTRVWVLAAVVSGVISSAPIAAAQSCAPPPSGVVSWWRGEGNANDSADGNNGVLQGAVVFASGKVGQALAFNGTNAYVSVTASSNLNVGAGSGLTIEGWINPSDVSSTHLISEWNNGSGALGVILEHSDSGIGGLGALAANVMSTSGVDHYFASSPNLITAGNFQHVALTYDKASGIGRLFYNGGVVAVQNMGVFTPQTTYGLNFGARAAGFPAGIFYKGLMDEMSLYSRALSTNEVAAIYTASSAGKCAVTNPPPPVNTNCVSAPSGLVSWWRGEQNALDSADGNHGTLVGNTSFGAGRVGQSFVLDGSGDMVSVGNPASLRLQNLTIEGWIKRASASQASFGSGGYGVIFGYGSGGYSLFLESGGTLVLTQIEINYVKSSVTVTDTNFHHVAVTKSGSTVVFYVDGVAYPATAYNPTFSFSTVAAIGGRGDNLDNSFNGSIDELAVYSGALSASEILAIYNAGSAGKCAPPPPVSTNCVTAPSGLVSWWRAEQNALDSADGNNGTLAGNVAYGAGRVGQSFVFDGDHDGVSVGNPVNLQLQNFTIEAWVKRSSASLATLAPEASPGSGAIYVCAWGGYGLGLFDDGRPFLTKVGYSYVDTSLAITDTNNFHHVAVTKSGSSVVFYVDGVADSSAGPYDPGFVFNGPSAIGARGGDLVATLFGSIDEVSVYNRALSAAEIQAVYNASGGGKCTGPTGPFIFVQPTNQTVTAGGSATFSVTAGGTSPLSYQWRKDAAVVTGATNATLFLANVTGSNAGDYVVIVANTVGLVTSAVATLTVTPAPTNCLAPPSGLVSWWRAEQNALDSADGNNGTLAGNVTYGAGRVGQSFVFDGDHDGVSVGNPVNLQLQNFTIEAWVKRSSASLATLAPEASPGSGAIYVCAWGGYGLGLFDDGRPFLTKVGYSYVDASLTITDTNNFHHVAVTKSGSSVVFYVDGVADSSAGPYDPGFVFNGPSAIGARGGDLVATLFGSIDEVSVYNRALVIDEIQSIYNAGSAGKCQNLATNHAPVARITVSPLANFPNLTNLVVISLNCSDAVVVLDGSQSSDADNDPLTYIWLDGTNALATGVTTTNTLDAGSHEITLLVSDGQDTDTDSVTVEVVTPNQAVGLAIALIEESDLPRRNTRPLIASLKAVVASFDDCNLIPGISQLQAFQNKVQAQVAPANPTLAAQLIETAQAIIDALNATGE